MSRSRLEHWFMSNKLWKNVNSFKTTLNQNMLALLKDNALYSVWILRSKINFGNFQVAKLRNFFNVKFRGFFDFIRQNAIGRNCFSLRSYQAIND